jgi:hypothetical protein
VGLALVGDQVRAPLGGERGEEGRLASGAGAFAPAAAVTGYMDPSTYAGTPESMCDGGVPSRSGQAARTRS